MLQYEIHFRRTFFACPVENGIILRSNELLQNVLLGERAFEFGENAVAFQQGARIQPALRGEQPHV